MNRKSYCSVLGLIGLTLVFSTLTFLSGCSSSSHTVTPPVVTIAATSGGNQTAQVGTAFTNPLAATVMTGTTPTSGVTVTFTAPAATDGTFADGGTPAVTDTETTNASGVATSTVFTAGTAAGTYTVTAKATGAAAAANFSLTNTAGAAANLTATGGTPQNVVTGATAASLVAQVTDGDGNGVAGVSVTFTAPAVDPSGTFTSTGTNTETDTTDANGNATAADFVAGAIGGPYNVTASSGTLTPVNFSLTNVVSTAALGNGTYVFSLAGQDVAGAYVYYAAGAFTVSGGAITTGEQDFVDYFNPTTLTDPITSGTIVATADGNLQITLVTADTAVGVGGTETLNATLVSSSRALITEFDASATASGELDLQVLPSGGGTQGYAFFVNGGDFNGLATGIGGVVNVDGTGTISGAGSVFDINDGGTVLQNQPIDSGTVSTPDSFGRIQVSLVLTTSTVGGIGLAGYIVDSNRVRLVENGNDPNDTFFGVTGGTALAQGTNTGTFNAASIEGSAFVFATTGQDVSGYLQVAGVLTTNVDGTTVSGTLNANDLTGTGAQEPEAFTGTYTVDPTGRVTLSNLTATGGGFTGLTVQFYLSGGGSAVAVSMDAADEWAGPVWLQTGGGSFTAGSFAGIYAFDATGFGPPLITGPEFDAVGPVTADGTTSALTGFVDQNLLGGTPIPDVTVSGTFTANASGIFSDGLTGLDVTTPANSDVFTYYLIDTTKVVAIETDANQLTLGYFELTH